MKIILLLDLVEKALLFQWAVKKSKQQQEFCWRTNPHQQTYMDITTYFRSTTPKLIADNVDVGMVKGVSGYDGRAVHLHEHDWTILVSW